MAEFTFQAIFPLTEDATEYRLLDTDHVAVGTFDGAEILKVAPEGLTLLARQAFTDVSHLLAALAPEAAGAGLRGPGELRERPLRRAGAHEERGDRGSRWSSRCARTPARPSWSEKRAQRVFSGDRDEEALTRGDFQRLHRAATCATRRMRPSAMYEERQHRAATCRPRSDLRRGAATSTASSSSPRAEDRRTRRFLFQETTAVLNPKSLLDFLRRQDEDAGHCRCPPYHLAVVVGGTSAEPNLKTVKLASAGLPGRPAHQAARPPATPSGTSGSRPNAESSRDIGLGAQFGGKWFCLDARVIRLPRHGASCPIGLGVSCSADRNVKAKITRQGVFLEQLETDSGPVSAGGQTGGGPRPVPVDLNRPMAEIRAQLSRYPVATPLLLTGRIIVARDIAHAKLNERLERGEGLPDYFKNHIDLLRRARPRPRGLRRGLLRPHHRRPDGHLRAGLFQAQGASLVMLAKGNRTKW